jgi:hypothetical protein
MVLTDELSVLSGENADQFITHNSRIFSYTMLIVSSEMNVPNMPGQFILCLHQDWWWAYTLDNMSHVLYGVLVCMVGGGGGGPQMTA